MTTLTELLEQALEALERFNQCAVPIVNTVNPVEFTWSRARLDVANQRAEHVVAAIRTHLERSGEVQEPAVPQWLPIETAPRDDTEILVANSDGSQAVAQWSKYANIWDYGVGDEGAYWATHWMPLPAPTPKEPT